MIESRHLFERRKLHGLLCRSMALAVNQLGPGEPVDGPGQGVVIAVALTANERFDACFGQPLGVADADSVGVPD